MIHVILMMQAFLDKMSCLCGFNNKDGEDGGQVHIKVKVKQKCCNKVSYDRSVHIVVQDPATLAQILRKIDNTLEEISVSSQESATPTTSSP